MKPEKSFYKDIIKPVVVLLVICLSVSLILGVANAVTAPIIRENELAAALKNRQELLPDATGFTELDYSDNPQIRSVHSDDGGSGVIVVTEMPGYGGLIITTVAIDSNGQVLGLRIDSSTETKGIGTQVSGDRFMGGFIGKDRDTLSVDTITNATYSSRAVIDSVNAALRAFDEVKGG